MVNRPQQTTVCIGQQRDGRWRILLDYEDGSTFLSNRVFATEKEAEEAARQWTLENAVPEGPPQ